MARIPAHTIEDAPAAARPLLAEMVQCSPTGRLLAEMVRFSPAGRLLNMRAQLAHAPALREAAAAKPGVPAGPAHAGQGA